MSENSLHKFKTYDEQLKILTEEKNLIIDDQIFAITTLQHYSYYSIINGYKDLFLIPNSNPERFIDGTTFSMLYQAHWMDMSLSAILFKYTLLIEKKLKTRLAYLLGKNYKEKEEDYLRPSIYSQSRYHRGKLNEIIKAIDDKKNIDISAIHYIKREGNLPPWVATKAVSFGTAFIWYSILTEPHKRMIIKDFLVPCPFLKNESLTDYFNRLMGQVYQYRNLSAHGNRSFKLNISEEYKLIFNHLKSSNLEDLFNKYNRANLYSVIISIFILLDDRFAVSNFLRELNIFFHEYDNDNFNFNQKNIYDLFDLPNDFLERIDKLVKSKQYRTKFSN